MQTAVENLPVSDFPMPAGLVRANVCGKSGLLPNAFCPPDELENDVFVQGTVPTEIDNVYVEATIDTDTGLLATPYSQHTETRVFVNRPLVSGQYQPLDMKEALPALHSPIPAGLANQMVTVKICTDPRNHGIPYLANIPGFLEEGGTPPQFIQDEQFPASQVPDLYDPLPDHQVRKINVLQSLNNIFQ
jgi:penicillin-binding protein 1A